MKIVHCSNTPDGYDFDVWLDNKLLDRFKTKKAAQKFIEKYNIGK